MERRVGFEAHCDKSFPVDFYRNASVGRAEQRAFQSWIMPDEITVGRFDYKEI